jgi:hypothetical protein
MLFVGSTLISASVSSARIFSGFHNMFISYIERFLAIY